MHYEPVDGSAKRVLDAEWEGAAPFDPEGHYELALFEALTVHVGETEIALGTAVCTMTSARVVPLPGGELRATPRDTEAAQRVWAPGQTPPPDDPKPVHARLVEQPPPRCE
jgi:hypothetical protein